MYYVFCIFECLRAPRRMGKCSLGLPSLNKDFIIIIIIIIIQAICVICWAVEGNAVHFILECIAKFHLPHFKWISNLYTCEIRVQHIVIFPLETHYSSYMCYLLSCRRKCCTIHTWVYCKISFVTFQMIIKSIYMWNTGTTHSDLPFRNTTIKKKIRG